MGKKNKLAKQTIDEIKKEVAQECSEDNFEVLFEAEITVGDYDTAKSLWKSVGDRYVYQFMEKEAVEYVLGDNTINGIQLNDKIRQNELHEYYITHRESFIDELIGWISETTKCKELMKQDLKMLMAWDDEYILSSNSTNSYIGKDSSEFNETCKEILEINIKLNGKKE